MIYSVLSIALLIFGFGFVIFFHELGHFLAAKWARVRVEQFAVGFGHALLAWRKGIGVRVGTTRPEYEQRCKQYLKSQEGLGKTGPLAEARNDDQRMEIAAEQLGLGETEYRLNWIPLGGYVKMLGQDDLRPGAVADHPKAYNNKTIGQRMVIVSAGVIMNVILAAILFMGLFLMGFNRPPAVVGSVLSGSPAQAAGLNSGDRIITFDGKLQHDFTKISLNVALSREDVPTPMTVQRVDGRTEQIMVTPQRMPFAGAADFLILGIDRPLELRGADARFYPIPEEHRTPELFRPETYAIGPGEIITHLNGEPVNYRTDYHKLDRAIQASRGEPVVLTVQADDGETREVNLRPRLGSRYWDQPLNIAGMVPRTTIGMVTARSPARGQLLPGDVVLSITSVATGDRRPNPTDEELRDWLNRAGAQGHSVTLEVLRNGERIVLDDIQPSLRVSNRPPQYGLGVILEFDIQPIVAGVAADTPAADAGIDRGARITHVNGTPVENWFQVHQALREIEPGKSVRLTAQLPAAERGEATEAQYTLRLDEKHHEILANLRYIHGADVLAEHNVLRRTGNPLIAAWWGVTETRDFILQFYLTLQRMIERSVSYKNLMGPVGIVQAGTHFAWRGTDWLIWFLAMISANLAVVNFLPIPIVDGGLFTFLILEKIKGKPISARTQAIAQVVGMAVILSVFLLVTYQDILRLIS